jgi:hypothetical protein
MSERDLAATVRNGFGPGFAFLGLASLTLAVLGTLALVVALALAVAGATLATVARVLLPRPWRFLGLLPVLASLGVLVAYAPLGLLPELAAGVAGLALLLWCGEDPDRSAGAAGRGLTALFVPGAAFSLALLSSLLLPSGLGSVGIAAALLAASTAAAVLLLRAPELFERDPAASS